MLRFSTLRLRWTIGDEQALLEPWILAQQKLCVLRQVDSEEKYKVHLLQSCWTGLPQIQCLCGLRAEARRGGGASRASDPQFTQGDV